MDSVYCIGVWVCSQAPTTAEAKEGKKNVENNASIVQDGTAI